MDIGFYIADLLRNQDEVSLPGLGTFTKERIAGSYDSTSNSFRPPAYQVSFVDATDDSGALSAFISRSKNLSLSSADYFIKRFTGTLTELLQTSGIAEVKPLGIIRQREESLVFEPSQSYSLPGKFYGLKPVAERPQIRPMVADPVTENIQAPSQGFIEDFISGLGDEEFQEEEVFTESRESRSALYITGFIILLIAAVIVLYFFNPAVKSTINSAFTAPAASVVAPAPADTTANVLQPVNDTVDTAASLVVDSISSIAPATVIEKKATEPEVEKVTIEIIGGSFGRKSEADTYIEEMKKKGIHARILHDMPGPLFKVSLGSFPDQASAEPELLRIRKDISKEAWPVKYKLKKTQ